jgi:hypothetical protein
MLTVKFFPAIPSTKYLNGAMLTVIILLAGSFSLPQETIEISRSKLNNLFIRCFLRSGTKLTHNIRKGLGIGNKLYCSIFDYAYVDSCPLGEGWEGVRTKNFNFNYQTIVSPYYLNYKEILVIKKNYD